MKVIATVREMRSLKKMPIMVPSTTDMSARKKDFFLPIISESVETKRVSIPANSKTKNLD